MHLKMRKSCVFRNISVNGLMKGHFSVTLFTKKHQQKLINIFMAFLET